MGTTKDGYVLYDIKRDELKTHLPARIEHHVKRNKEPVAKADEIDKELRSNVDSARTVTERMSIKGSSVFADPARERDGNLMRAREHAQGVTRLTFLVDHLPVDTVLQLCEQELVQLEFFTGG